MRKARASARAFLIATNIGDRKNYFVPVSVHKNDISSA